MARRAAEFSPVKRWQCEKPRYLIVEPRVEFIVFSIDPTVTGMRFKICFAGAVFALPSAKDVPLAPCVLHEFRPDGCQLEIIGPLVGLMVKLGRKIVRASVQIGDAGPNPVPVIPDHVYRITSHGR